MFFYVTPLSELSTILPPILEESFDCHDAVLEEAIQVVKNFTKGFVADLWIGIETSYIDKLYRDTYYNYYSSKLNEYKRDCVRLSFYTEKIIIDDFFSETGAVKLQNSFRGFVVLRPTAPNIIGRNVLHPGIISKKLSYHISTATFSACVYGVKLNVDGFPHSSQDEEFMVCAETTVWSMMEYFSTRYPEYQPVLPRKIHSLLSKMMAERQIPSSGLNGLHISFALKELGFGAKRYLAKEDDEVEYEQLLEIIRIYVESGIPLMALLKNNKGTAHIVNVVGRTAFYSPVFPKPIYSLPGGGQILSYYNQDADYILIDDNHPAYCEVPLEEPVRHYENVDFHGCTIIAAIVPLHRRIYMEASRAKALAISSLEIFDKEFKKLPNLCLRLLLSSTRTFKNAVAHNPDLSLDHKTLLLGLNMPKFVWIVEVGTQESYADGKATGMLLLDATEPKSTNILAYLLENEYIGSIKGKKTRLSIPLPPFRMHQNLKTF